ncbi:MAG TPA: DUF1801 domain-containing protein [Candidatus Limnocylindria bacterium]|nr:DUF1801 domain-containing protein [Candidatus Limnocylindria bacterium]
MATTGDTTKKTTTGKGRASTTWTDEERAAMQEHAREMKAARSKKADGEADVRAKIDELPEPDRSMADRIHAIIREAAPELKPRTWYGMPAYANAAGKVICFFTPASKFKERYASFGFNADAQLDEGTMWPTSWAITKLTPDAEARIRDLVRRSVGQ